MGRFHQADVVVDQIHPGTLEGSTIGRLGAGQRTGVGHGGGGAILAGGDLADHNGLVLGPRIVARLHQAHRVRRAFEQHGDRRGVGVVGQEHHVIGHVDIAGIAAGQHVADRHAALQRLFHAEAKRAGLADHPDGMRERAGHLGIGHEGDARLQPVVHRADAVRPDQRNAGIAGQLGQAGLLVDAVLGADLRIARGEDDDTASA